MPSRLPIKLCSAPILWLCLIASIALTIRGAEKHILHLKSGDRVSGEIVSEDSSRVVLTNSLYGTITVPLAEISKREQLPSPTPVPQPAPVVTPSTNALVVTPPSTNTPMATNVVSVPTANATTNAPAALPKKSDPKKEPIAPANPEAQPIAATPNFWKHEVEFGLSLRYSTKDQQDYLIRAKSTYGKAPMRHLFEYNFNYGKTDGEVSADRMSGSEKSEYQFSKKTYVFNLIGGGYDKVREVDAQYEISPGLGVELLNSTNVNLVLKNELGFTFQEQFRTDHTRKATYSLRLAGIVAWKIWDRLTADAKAEFFPNLEEFGEYRLRFESTLRYPLTERLSLNLVVIDLFDTLPPEGVRKNDLQIRSTLGINF